VGPAFVAYVEILLNMPVGGSLDLFGYSLPALQLVSLMSLRQRVPKARITDRRWDPDTPGGVMECVISAGDADDGSGNRTASTNPTTQADADVVADVARTLVLSVCDRQLIDVLLEQLASVTAKAQPEASEVVACIAALRNLAADLWPVRKYLKNKILPKRTDFSEWPEYGHSLRGRLVRLLASPSTGMQNIAGDFLYTLCARNAARLVRYIGYGNAAGFLAGNGMSGMPPPVEDSDSDNEEMDVDKVNPVTGQNWPSKTASGGHSDATAEMTEEEKEYRAAELMDLMQKLNKSGVVKCQLPDVPDG
jgi:hypothetical protein